MHRSESWFIRQLAHCRDMLAEADKQHTEQELAEATAALAVYPDAPQRELAL